MPPHPSGGRGRGPKLLSPSPYLAPTHSPREDAENRRPRVGAAVEPRDGALAQPAGWPEWVRLGQSPPLPRAPAERAVVVIQQWEGPRPLGRVRSLGAGELASAPGERQDQQRRRRSRGPQKQDVVSSFRNRRLGAPGLWGGGGAGRAEDLGLPLALSLLAAPRATAQGCRAAGRHPGPRSCRRRGDRGVDGLVGALWCFCTRVLLRSSDDSRVGGWPSPVQAKLSERLPRGQLRAGRCGGKRRGSRTGSLSPRGFPDKEEE